MPYTPYQRADSASSTVAGGAGGVGTPLNPSDTTLSLPTGKGALFPATPPFMLYIGGSELAKCTLRASDTLTIARGQEGTTAGTWPVNTTVELVETAATLANTDTELQHLMTGIYNVRDTTYGATGDGATDDRAALQAALDAARTAGGGVVYLPTGTYLLNSTDGSGHCLTIGANTLLRGDGRSATVLKFGANLPDGTIGLINVNHTNPGGDADITLQDFTLDGNAANQTALNAHFGVNLSYTQGSKVQRVRFLNVYGTGSSGAAEGFFLTLNNSSDASVSDCACVRTAGSCSTGFSANYSTNVQYVNCTAHGMNVAMGFTNYGCTHVSYANCTSYQNTQHGFNSEVGTDIEYVNCQSGLIAASQGANIAYPFTSGQALGNTLNGFNLRGSQRVALTNCVAEKNGGNGVQQYLASPEAINGQYLTIMGGSYSFNTGYGVQLDANATGFAKIFGRPRLTTNTAGTFSVFVNGSATSVFAGGAQPAVTVPTSTTSLTSPFPIDSWLIVTGGTVTAVQLNGATVSSSTPYSYFVPAGSAVSLTYSVAPTWTWHALLG